MLLIHHDWRKVIFIFYSYSPVVKSWLLLKQCHAVITEKICDNAYLNEITADVSGDSRLSFLEDYTSFA